MSGDPGPEGSHPWRDLPTPDPDLVIDPLEPLPPEPAVDAAPPSPDAARVGWVPTGDDTAPVRPALPPMDTTTRLTLGAGLALAILGLLGVAVGTWNFAWSGIILILAGLVGAAGGWIGLTNAGRSLMVAARDVVLIGGTIGAVLGLLFVLQLITDLDHLDGYGGAIGLIMALLTAVAGGALYVAAARHWNDRPLAPWAALARGELPGRLLLIGAGLVIVGWLGNVTIGAWFLDAGVLTISLVLLAALVSRAEADPDQPMRLPIPAAFVAIVLAGLAALGAIGQTMALAETHLGLDDWLVHLLAVAGVVVAIVGAALGVMETTRAGMPAGKDPAAH